MDLRKAKQIKEELEEIMNMISEEESGDPGNRTMEKFAEIENRISGLETELRSRIDSDTGKAAEQAEGLFDRILENLDEAVVYYNTEGKITAASAAWESITGYSPESSKEKFLHSFTTAALQNDLQSSVLSIFKEGRTTGKTDCVLYSREGFARWVSIKMWAEQDKDGSAFGAAVIKDITSKKMSDEMLLRQRDQLRSIVKAVDEIFNRKNFFESLDTALRYIGETAGVDRVYVFENDYYQTEGEHTVSMISEWSTENIQSRAKDPGYKKLKYSRFWPELYDLLYHNQQVSGTRDDFPDEVRRYLVEEKIYSILLVPIHTRDDFWGFIGLDDCRSAKEWTEGEGSIGRLAALAISKQVDAERARRELKRVRGEAIEAGKLKSTFLANMSHELRTPMNGILGYANILRDEMEDPEYQKMSETIYRSALRLMETLDLILDLSKIEADKMELYYNQVNVSRLVNEVAFNFTRRANGKNIYLKVDFSDSNLTVRLDERVLRAILNNLISNAIKFTEKGGVTVTISNEKEETMHWTVVAVEDTGIGIPEDKIKLIFDEFRQGSEGFNRRYEGIGLGLTITKRFVELLNGELLVSSDFGSGTTFTVKIPSKMDEVEVSDEEKYLQRLPRIMLVEDDDISIEVVSTYLKGMCNVDIARSGEEAIEKAGRNKYSAILMDINLGRRMDGIDTTREIRKISEYDEVPIVAVTAFAMAGDEGEFMKAGCTHYLSKPFEKSELISLIKEILYS